MPTAGEQLGPYQLLSLIGEGGMGEVYKARDTRLDRIVALKVSKSDFSDRFEREARAVAALNHPNICQLYDVGPNYLVMEYIEGTAIQGPLPIEKAIPIASQILDALDAAHRKGITHRDLKPANILLTKQGVKLLDFGLAKQQPALPGPDDKTVAAALTKRGEIVGTLQYMAPEQLQGEEADARSDIFAFGCVLYELLSGKRAFDGQSAASVIASILEREPAPLNLHPPLDRVVRTCLAKDPHQRFQNAGDLKRNLQWALTEQPARRPANRIWPLATLVIVACLFAGWLLRPPRLDRDLHLSVIAPPGAAIVPTGLNEGGMVLSPDGRSLAFVVYKERQHKIWVRQLNSFESRPLEGTEGAYAPFWSADSRSIGFFTIEKLKRVEAIGGPVQVICEVAYGRGATWNQYGDILFTSARGGINRVSATGGVPVELFRPSENRGETNYAWPHFLPDGKSFLLQVGRRTAAAGTVLASLDSPGAPQWIAQTDTGALFVPALGGGLAEGPGHLLFLRGGAMMALPFDPSDHKAVGEALPILKGVEFDVPVYALPYSVSKDGLLAYSKDSLAPMRLVWRNRTGTETNHFTPVGLETISLPRISPSGEHVAFSTRGRSAIDLWVTRLDGSQPVRLTFGEFAIFPAWSSDGRSVVFSTRDAIVRRLSNGAGSQEILKKVPASAFVTDFSSDGQFVLLSARANSNLNNDIRILPTGQRAEIYPYLESKANEGHAQFSPNGRWIAYSSDETGRREVYVQEFIPGRPASGGRWQISLGGGTMPRWRGDGAELFYLTLEGVLTAVNTQAGGAVFHSGPPVSLFNAMISTLGNSGINYDVARDGKTFLLLEPDPTKPLLSISVVTNWLNRGKE